MTHPTSAFQSLLVVVFTHICIYAISVSTGPLPACSHSDYASLKAFQASILNHLPWPDNTNCCMWPGIQCNHCGRVVALQLPSMGLKGSLSPHFFNLSALRTLDLSSNSFYGPIPSNLESLFQLTTLDLSHNPLLTGPLPPQLPLNLHYLDLSHCSFHGPIPSTIANMSNLKEAYLAHNSFSSFIPAVSSAMGALQTFEASHNVISGSIPDYILNCTSLKTLNLDLNNLRGQIPPEISRLSNVETLQLQGNAFTGSIPREIGKCTHLKQMWLDDNSLNGSIPAELFGLTSLMALSLSNNSLQGPLTAGILSSTQLAFLSVSGNKLSGEIPAALGVLGSLKVLLLDGNDFSGLIPAELGRLRDLQILDLSRNSLDGPIPYELASKTHRRADTTACLGVNLSAPSDSWILKWVLGNDFKQRFGKSMTMMGYMQCLLRSNNTGLHCVDLSSNHFTGLVSTFLDPGQADVRDMNMHGTSIRRYMLEGQGSRSKIFAGVGVAGGALLIVGILLICRLKFGGWQHKRLNRRPTKLPSLRKFHRETSKVFDPNLESISMRILVRATNNFDKDRVVGDGGFGYVFSGTLPDGRLVAVKKLSPGGTQGKREFEAEMETLGNVKHPNLVSLLAYCNVGDDRVLVYEFIKNGSLDTWLHEKEEGPVLLNWKLRLRIAQGAASGLAYLHHECRPYVIHRDIKSSNILLGNDFTAHISDFGLARNTTSQMSYVSTEAAGTLGYMAPEYHTTMRATRRADVYSFGMVLLELATGLRPNLHVKERDLRTLVRWSIQLHEESCDLELLDPALKKGESCPPFEQVSAYFSLACECVRQDPTGRPSMAIVLKRLSEIGAEQAVQTP